MVLFYKIRNKIKLNFKSNNKFNKIKKQIIISKIKLFIKNKTIK